MNALTRIRTAALALGVVLLAGCSTDEPNSPTAPPVNPVPPAASVNVTVSASPSVLEAGGTEPSVITITATRSDNGAPVSGTATVTTSLGNLGSVGGPTTIEVPLVNGTGTVPLFPSATIGTASVRAQVGNFAGFAQVQIREGGGGETFFISSVSPSTGSPQGGETVIIHGAGFDDPIRVTFGGRQAPIQFASTTEIRVTTPPCSFSATDACFAAGATTPTDVTVNINVNEADAASDTLLGGFVYVSGGGGGTPQPVIFSVTPGSGPNEGGTQVTINGDGFQAPVQVRFLAGSLFAEAQVLSVTQSRIVVVSPPRSLLEPGQTPSTPLTVDIRVINQSSGRNTTATAAFRYGAFMQITAIAPNQGPPTGGTLVTIFGQGFDEPVSVTMAGRAQQVISVSGSEIVVRTVALTVLGCGVNVSGPTIVTNIESGDTATGPAFTYTVPQPAIFSLSPGSGPQGGNTLVTILGANLGSQLVVDFLVDGTPFNAAVQSSSSTSVVVRTASVPNDVLETEECDENGDPGPGFPNPVGERYISTAADVRVTDTATGCVLTLNGAFQYLPADTSCRGD